VRGPRLGHDFDEQQRREYVDRQLLPGRIIYLLDLPLTSTTKNKYAVLARASDPPLLLVMGRGIARLIQRDADRLARQVLLRASDYPCLAEDSYVDCTLAIATMSMEEVRGQLIADVSQLGDWLSAEDLRLVRDAVCGARTLSADEQTAIISALRQASPPAEDL